jgi:fructoselysine-6-P-deglycase FrlB-like protein
VLDRRTTHDDLIQHLVRTTPLQRGEALRVVLDVLAYFDETAEDFVRRRPRAAGPRHGERRHLRKIAKLAARYAGAKSMMFVGRVRGCPVAREAAQKLKEASNVTLRHIRPPS